MNPVHDKPCLVFVVNACLFQHRTMHRVCCHAPRSWHVATVCLHDPIERSRGGDLEGSVGDCLIAVGVADGLLLCAGQHRQGLASLEHPAFRRGAAAGQYFDGGETIVGFEQSGLLLLQESPVP